MGESRPSAPFWKADGECRLQSRLSLLALRLASQAHGMVSLAAQTLGLATMALQCAVAHIAASNGWHGLIALAAPNPSRWAIAGAPSVKNCQKVARRKPCCLRVCPGLAQLFT